MFDLIPEALDFAGANKQD